MRYDITPMGAPRMTRRDKWAKRPVVMRYFALRDEIRASGMVITDWSFVTFGIPMPDSWSKRKKAEFLGKPHRNRPDCDNLWKFLGDSIFQEDCHISRIQCRKIWAEKGFIEVEEIT
jgi:hypothetical protein